jgi:tetratricopeptide (TPR) repeat protein
LLELSTARKRLLHQKVALALEKNHAANNSKAYSLAQHFEAAGEIHKAFHYWQETAKYACQMLSETQTFDSFKNAENILKRHPSEFSDDEIYRFYSLWCEIASEDFENPENLQRAAVTMHRIGEQRRNPLMVGSGLNWQGVVELIHHHGPRGLELLSLARPYLEQAGELFELVNHKNTFGLLLLITNQGKEAHAVLEESIKLAEGSQIPRIMKAQINAQDQLALAYNMQGHPLKGCDHAQKALRKSELLFLSQKVSFSQNMVALSDYYLGEYKKGMELCKAVIKKEEEMPVWHWAVFNYHILTRCEIELGMLDSAQEHITKAIQINEPYQRPDFLSSGYMLLGTIHQFLKDTEGAISYFHQGIAAGGGGNFQTLESHYHLGEALLQNGRYEEGYAILKRTAEQARAAGLPFIYLPAEASYLQKEASRTSLLKDSAGIDAILAEVEERSLGGIAAFIRRVAGEISLLSGAPDAAIKIALSAVKCARQVSCPWVELQSVALLQRIHPDRHNVIRLQELLDSIGGHTKSDKLRPLFEKFEEETLVALI